MKKDNKKHEDKTAELENNWKRALADYRNLEKRVAEEKEAVIRFANSILILNLIACTPFIFVLTILLWQTSPFKILGNKYVCCVTIREYLKAKPQGNSLMA